MKDSEGFDDIRSGACALRRVSGRVLSQDRRRAGPVEFVAALTKAGWLAH
jgi:hypothetical protein